MSLNDVLQEVAQRCEICMLLTITHDGRSRGCADSLTALGCASYRNGPITPTLTRNSVDMTTQLRVAVETRECSKINHELELESGGAGEPDVIAVLVKGSKRREPGTPDCQVHVVPVFPLQTSQVKWAHGAIRRQS